MAKVVSNNEQNCLESLVIIKSKDSAEQLSRGRSTFSSLRRVGYQNNGKILSLCTLFFVKRYSEKC